MKNVADCCPDLVDREIREELRVCRIHELAYKMPGQFGASLGGQLGPFVFERFWYYWEVRGDVPAKMAAELWADPLGRRDVRANGYASNHDPAGRHVYRYHIDSEAGLRLFADTVRRHGFA